MDFEKNQQEKYKSKKETELERMREKVDSIVDSLGRPIDEGIKEAVVMFNLFDLPSQQSCEGHPEGEGFSFPWVEIGPNLPEDENWYENEELRQDIIKEKLEMQKKALDLMTEFYKDRGTPFDIMLATEGMGYSFRIQSNLGRVMEILPENEKKEKAKLTKEEMGGFTEFLKNKFLSLEK